MSKLPQPISNYVNRFIDQYNSLGIDSADEETFLNLILNNKSQINNLLMSGLGASTLILRLGAVINLSKKLEKGSDAEDAVLMKQIIDNLREILPSDTNWKIIWEITCESGSDWSLCVDRGKENQSLMGKFVTFRNKYVHEIISLRPSDIKKIINGIEITNKICKDVSVLFENTDLKMIDGEYHFIENKLDVNSKKTSLHPFVQEGSDDGLPYIFQGLYDNKKKAELISTFHGDIEEQEGSKHYDFVFNPIIKSLKGGAGRVFNHSEIIDYYNECFVGREEECDYIMEFIKNSEEPDNILPIYSTAGMGKGALIANIINNHSDPSINIPILYHFCHSGMANNLHAILYHFILQGKRSQIWDIENEEILKKIKRLPSKYPDLIMLFQELLDNFFKINRNNTFGNLTIIIDGLDEAAVAYSEYHIKDYFSKYDENGEVISDWRSKSNIKWIFTYREGFYSFPKLDNIFKLNEVQPLKGLNEEAVQKALKQYNPSEEFIETVKERGKVNS